MDKIAKGKMGEDAVCEELKRRGHKIIARNFHKRIGEIDIISEIDGFVVFTEVKARGIRSMVSGLEAVNFTKQKKIVLTADAWLTENPTRLQPRYDIAEVEFTRGEFPRITRIQIYEDAFTADGIYTVN